MTKNGLFIITSEEKDSGQIKIAFVYKQYRKNDIMNMIKLEIMTIKEAAEEAGGNEQILQEMFDKFKQWLQQQLHLPQEISDKKLQLTLLSAKFNLEKAKKRLDSLYTFHNLIPEFFSDYDPLSDSIARFYKSAQWIILPKLTEEKYRVTLGRWVTDDTSMFYPQDMIKYVFMLWDILAEEDTVNSEVLLWDCKGLTLGHLLKYTPSLLKKCNLCLEAYGSRLKAIYMINAPTYTEHLMSILKKAFKPKLFNRIHVSGSGIESLNGAIPKSILPANYGGDEPSTDTLKDMWHAKLIERREWLLRQEKLKVNESLRTNSVINPDDLFGVAGTFRKLEID